MTLGTGNRTRATLVGGERSRHCAIPAPPNYPRNLLHFSNSLPLSTYTLCTKTTSMNAKLSVFLHLEIQTSGPTVKHKSPVVPSTFTINTHFIARRREKIMKT